MRKAVLWIYLALFLASPISLFAQESPEAKGQKTKRDAVEGKDKGAVNPESEDRAEGEDFDMDFDPDLVDLQDEESFDTEAVAEEPLPFEVHGRIDVSLQVTDPNDPVENQDKIDTSLSEISLNLLYYPTKWLTLQTEIELESEGELEFDQLHATVKLGQNLPSLRGGIHYVPFGLERYYYAPPRNPFVNRPLAFRLIFPGTYPDLGFFVFGELKPSFLPKIQYDFSAVLGLQGPDREGRREVELRNINNFEDNNKDWQYSGRVSTILYENVDDPSRMALLFEFGASFLTGIYDDDDRRRLSLLGVDVRARISDFYFLLEHVRGKVELVDPARTQERNGTYLWLMYKPVFNRPWLESIHLAARYGVIDPDERFRDGFDLERYSFVAAWEPYPNLRLKLQYEQTRERVEALRRQRRSVLVQLAFNF